MPRRWQLLAKLRGKRHGVSIAVPANFCPPGTTDRHEISVTLYGDEVIEGDFWQHWEGTFLVEVPPEKPKVTGSALSGFAALRAKAKPEPTPISMVDPDIEEITEVDLDAAEQTEPVDNIIEAVEVAVEVAESVGDGEPEPTEPTEPTTGDDKQSIAIRRRRRTK